MKYNYEQERNDYLSPKELIFMALRTKQRISFDLDVCCLNEYIPALHYYKENEIDGLNAPWRKLNWCNPPFKECRKWIRKAYLEQKRGNETVMLLPVRTETAYWHDYILFNPKVKIQWLKKGYRFLNPVTLEPMGVFKNALALVYFNKENRYD